MVYNVNMKKDLPIITQERRRDLMIILKENGEKLDAIAGVFGLSRERVRQILSKEVKYPDRWSKYRKHLYKYNKVRKLEGRDYKRELIREYFNHTCQGCGRVWHEGERRFDIHHLSCDPKDSRKYDKDVDFNSVTLLCHKCHMNLPGTRKAMMKPHIL